MPCWCLSVQSQWSSYRCLCTSFTVMVLDLAQVASMANTLMTNYRNVKNHPSHASSHSMSNTIPVPRSWSFVCVYSPKWCWQVKINPTLLFLLLCDFSGCSPSLSPSLSYSSVSIIPTTLHFLSACSYCPHYFSCSLSSLYKVLYSFHVHWIYFFLSHYHKVAVLVILKCFFFSFLNIRCLPHNHL